MTEIQKKINMLKVKALSETGNELLLFHHFYPDGRPRTPTITCCLECCGVISCQDMRRTGWQRVISNKRIALDYARRSHGPDMFACTCSCEHVWRRVKSDKSWTKKCICRHCNIVKYIPT